MTSGDGDDSFGEGITPKQDPDAAEAFAHSDDPDFKLPIKIKKEKLVQPLPRVIKPRKKRIGKGKFTKDNHLGLGKTKKIAMHCQRLQNDNGVL